MCDIYYCKIHTSFDVGYWPGFRQWLSTQLDVHNIRSVTSVKHACISAVRGGAREEVQRDGPWGAGGPPGREY